MFSFDAVSVNKAGALFWSWHAWITTSLPPAIDVMAHHTAAATAAAANGSGAASGEGREGGAAGAAGAAATGPEERREKKARQKRAKQRQAVEALGGRAAYSAIAEALRDRGEKRGQWADRECDKVRKISAKPLC